MKVQSEPFIDHELSGNYGFLTLRTLYLLHSASCMNRYLSFMLLLAALGVAGCAGSYRPPVMKAPFTVAVAAPDYSEAASWAALPWKSAQSRVMR